MDRDRIRTLLEEVRSGEIDPEHALESLARLPFSDVPDARVDTHRALRIGIPEVVYAPGKTPEQIVESALRELGNIIASQTVSAIADSLGATIMLSVPTLVMQDAGVVLLSLITQRGAWIRIETDLYRPDEPLSALLVFAPDWPKPDAL